VLADRANGQCEATGYAVGIVSRYRAFFIAVIASAALAGLGCGGGYIGGAKRAYGQGRYLEAAEKLGQHEDEVPELSPRRQADYGIYRGLSFMMLNDYPAAMEWFAFVYDVERRAPGTLRPDQQRELDHGWGQVTQRLGYPEPGFSFAPEPEQARPAPLPPPR
jgi:hypothetical protein